jgi:hypothetical protein
VAAAYNGWMHRVLGRLRSLRGMRLAAAVAVTTAVVAGIVIGAMASLGSNQTMVPSQVREVIAKDYPRMAFLPGRLPSGYHYASWNNCADRLCYAIGFSHGSGPIGHAVVGLGEPPGKSQAYLELQVKRQSCPAPPKYPAKDTHTLHVNGHALKWLHADTGGPFVWRCMTNQGRSFVIAGFGGRPRQKLAEVTELVGYARPAH